MKRFKGLNDLIRTTKSRAIYVNVSIFTYLKLVPFNLNLSIILYAYTYQTALGENIVGLNEENVF